MRVLSKIFAIGMVVIVSGVAACGGSSESPPQPLQRRFDEMHVAIFPLEKKTDMAKAQQDWQVSRMENAQSEAQLGELATQLTVANNDRKTAKIAVESAVTEKKAAEKSADTNRINTAQQQLHTAELGLRAAEARVKYFEAFKAYLKRKSIYTAENMYWRESQFELSKAQLAQQNNIAPKGIQFDWFPKQESERSKRAQIAREKQENEKQRAMGARDAWLKAQQAADQASGKPSSYPDPLAPAPAPAAPTPPAAAPAS
jgi:hypothetical protein